MLDFITSAAGQLGVGEDAVKSVTGGVLGMVKEKAGDSAFGQLAGAVPGLTDVLGAAAPAAESTGGGLGGLIGGLTGGAGGLAGMAGNLIGGDAGKAISAAAGLGALFKSGGLDLDQGGSLVNMLVGHLKEKAGSELLGTVLGKVPELSKFLN